jgi:hypothetical protein
MPAMDACAHTTAGVARITSAAATTAHPPTPKAPARLAIARFAREGGTRPTFPFHENDSMPVLSIFVLSHAEMPCEERSERTREDDKRRPP